MTSLELKVRGSSSSSSSWSKDSVKDKCAKGSSEKGCAKGVWSSHGRSIDNNNFGVSSPCITSSSVSDFCLTDHVEIPICEGFSNPAADKTHLYYSTDQTYVGGTYTQQGVFDSSSACRGSGLLIKVCRSTRKIVQCVKFSDLSCKKDDACRYTPTLHGKYVYVASSVPGLEGTMLCLKKKDLSCVVWKRALTCGSSTASIPYNGLVVNLNKLPSPEELGKVGFCHSLVKEVICRRKALLKKNPLVLFTGTAALLPPCPAPSADLSYNGKLYCLDACTGCVIWSKDTLPRPFVAGDKVTDSILRYDEKTCQRLAWAYAKVVVATGDPLISFQTAHKAQGQRRLFDSVAGPNAPFGAGNTVVFFFLGAVGDAVPPFLVGQTLTLVDPLGNLIPGVTLGATVLAGQENATGYTIYNLSSYSAIPAELNGFSILEPIMPCDVLDSSEAASLSYYGGHVLGNPLVFDPLRWQLITPVGAATVPFDELIYLNGLDFSSQGQYYLSLLGDLVALQAVILAYELLSADPSNPILQAGFETAKNAYYALVSLLEARRKKLSDRAQYNFSNSLISVDSADGCVVWAYRPSPFEIWLNSIGSVLASPWDAEFGFNVHIYRCEKSSKDLYVAANKSGLLVSLSANEGKECEKMLVGLPSASLPSLDYGSASDGRFFYAVVSNPEGYTLVYNQHSNLDSKCVVPRPYYGAGQSYVIKYDPFKGVIEWSAPIGALIFSVPMVCNDVLYVPDPYGYLRMFRTCDGRSLGTLVLPFSGFARPVILDDVMVVVGGAHSLSCLLKSSFLPGDSILFYKIKEKSHVLTKECVKPLPLCGKSCSCSKCKKDGQCSKDKCKA